MTDEPATYTVHLFGEDEGHRDVVGALLHRLADDAGVRLDVRPRSVTRGHGRMLSELADCVHDLTHTEALPDLLVVARDTNCRGRATTQREIQDVLGRYADFTLLALPDPHIERWLLLDSAAFREVLGRGCQAPDAKCAKDRYKQTLAQAVRDADVTPLQGGLEYADDLVDAMDLGRMVTADDSLGAFIAAVRNLFRRWAAEAA